MAKTKITIDGLNIIAINDVPVDLLEGNSFDQDPRLDNVPPALRSVYRDYLKLKDQRDSILSMISSVLN